MIDQFTKWVEIHAIPKLQKGLQESLSISFLHILVLCCRFTDQGKNFDGQVMKALCHLYHIVKTLTTPYHPSGKGQAEHYN